MKTQNNTPIIYQASNGALELKGDPKKETIWASLDQIAQIFGRDKSVISRHIKNIFEEKELNKKSVVAFFATTAKDGKTYQVEYFNLDVIISVGYRVNSKVATQFRQWATQTLKKHITDGFTLKPNRIEKNYKLFLQAVEDVKKLSANNTELQTNDILELVKTFAGTWFSLNSFDKESFAVKKQSSKTIKIKAQKLYNDLEILKKSLLAKGEATEIFAREKKKNDLAGIFANIFQSAFGKDVYSSVESKAVHLLYFIIKNHPFIDGNKRSGAFAFIWFLQKSNFNFRDKITPEALTALALLIAQSNPQEKEKMVGLVILLLSKK